MALYTFARILSKLIAVTFHLLPVSSVFYLTPLALSIIYTLLLLTIKRYISLRNKAILTKMKKMTFTSQTNSIGKANLNIKANLITNLAIYLGFFFKYLLNIKDILYMIKKLICLKITYNKSMII